MSTPAARTSITRRTGADNLDTKLRAKAIEEGVPLTGS
jgi:hypothetical protein